MTLWLLFNGSDSGVGGGGVGGEGCFCGATSKHVDSTARQFI